MSDLSIFKLDNETINVKDTTARTDASNAKQLATTAAGNASTETMTITTGSHTVA